MSSPVVDVVPDDAIPLQDLDRALRPLRRVVAFVMRDPGRHLDEVRFFEANAGRWLRLARGLDLPQAVRDELDEVHAALSGYDAASTDERHRRIAIVYQAVARLDAQLGLPL